MPHLGYTCASCVDNSQRAHRDVYYLSSPCRRTDILAEMQTRLQTFNLSTSVKSAWLAMGPRTNWMSLVVLAHDTFHISHQLGSWLPDVMRCRIPPPADKVTCPLHVLHEMAHNTPHVKASTTTRIHQLLWWWWKDQVRISRWECRRLSFTTNNP